MISVSEAQRQILSVFSPIGSEKIEIEKALHRILAEPILADEDSPSFDNSSMDGIAVQAADVGEAKPDRPIPLDLIGSIPAGEMVNKKVRSGQAMMIMTGAPKPPGADAVVKVEHTNLDFSNPVETDRVMVFHPVNKGENIRKKGEFYKKHDTLLHPGSRIRPQDIALFAMTGKTSVEVGQKPKVGLLTTGDELTRPEDPISPGKIRDTNSYMLKGLIEQFGGEIFSTGIISDSVQAVTSAVQAIINSKVDFILTSGGVSMGAHDIVRQVLQNEGTLKLWRVNMRPGKPLAFGDYHDVPFIGLPGNPVSAFVGFYIFVRPVLQKLLNMSFPASTIETAKLMDSVYSDGRESYIPAKFDQVENTKIVSPALNQSSGNLFSLIPGNSLIILPIGVKFLNKGEIVNVLRLDLD